MRKLAFSENGCFLAASPLKKLARQIFSPYFLRVQKFFALRRPIHPPNEIFESGEGIRKDEGSSRKTSRGKRERNSHQRIKSVGRKKMGNFQKQRNFAGNFYGSDGCGSTLAASGGQAFFFLFFSFAGQSSTCPPAPCGGRGGKQGIFSAGPGGASGGARKRPGGALPPLPPPPLAAPLPPGDWSR